jgi:asparagine synthase (glutamine-hydrolysing)
MCGIAGIWERCGRPVDQAALERMSAILRHRGPDGSGLYIDGELGLANRRLAIVDVSPAGDQPMSLSERGLWLTYNGEIHNYVELRRELEALGSRFRTATDTEVVLHAYDAWGTDCFERFNGMWGLALWDARERRLVLARDRFGIKPLCYSVRGSRIAFASEPKAILAAFPEEREPDEAEIHRFLDGHYPDAGESTFFANVKLVPAGTCLVVSPDGLRQVRTWSFEPGDERPLPDAEERFRELLRDSIRLRMRSDVPVGTCLSGGLDSGAIAALVDIPADRPMHCFSLAFDEPWLGEQEYSAAAAAARPGSFVMHWVRPDPDDLLEVMGKIVWHHDAPAPIRGRLGHWFVMEEVCRSVKVVLDGQGGDELLAGYARFVLPYVLDRMLHPEGPQLGVLGELSDLGRIESRSRLWFLARTPLPLLQRSLGLPPWALEGVQRRDFSSRFAGPAPERERPYRSTLNNMLWHELRSEGLPEVLHTEDALSMAFSVESRTPFLDHRLVELCFSLPYSEKMAGGWTKSLLRRALADEMPQVILERRRKMGYGSPGGAWLNRDETWAGVRELLLDPRSLDRGIFDLRRLERALTRYRRGPAIYAAHRTGRVWRWINLELWFRRFVDEPVA